MAKGTDKRVGSGQGAKARPGWLYPVVVSVLVGALVGSIAVSLYPTPPLLRDALGYTQTAQRLVRTGEFSFGVQPPTFEQAPNALITPGQVLLLGGVYGLVGRSVDSTAAVVAAQPVVNGLEFVLALVTVALIAGCGYVLGGRKLSYVAGLFSAFYLPLWWSTTVALSECLAATLAAGQLLVALVLAGSAHRRSLPLAFALGALSAALALVRPVTALWLAIPLAYLALRRVYDWRRLAVVAGVAVAGFALLMVPWWVRNAATLRAFVPLSEGAGNPMLLSTGGYPLTPEEQAVYDAAAASNKDPESSVAIYRLSRDFQASPFALVGSRLGYNLSVTTQVWLVPNDAIWEELYDAEATRIGFGPFPAEPSDALVTAETFAGYYHVFLIGAALVGLVFIRRVPLLALVASVPVYLILMHSVTLFINRYFFPAMPAVIVLAAAGVLGLVRVASRSKVQPAS